MPKRGFEKGMLDKVLSPENRALSSLKLAIDKAEDLLRADDISPPPGTALEGLNPQLRADIEEGERAVAHLKETLMQAEALKLRMVEIYDNSDRAAEFKNLMDESRVRVTALNEAYDTARPFLAPLGRGFPD